jgi:integrase/recombinase XerD
VTTLTPAREHGLEVAATRLPALAAHAERRTAWADLVARYLAPRKGRTLEGYASDLNDLTAWADARGLDPLDLDRALADLWVRDLEARRYAPATIARRIAAVAGAYRYALEEGVLDRDPFARVKRPRVPSTSPRHGLTLEEARRVLEVAHPDPRDAVLAGLLLLLGVRASEVGAITRDALKHDRGHLTVTLAGKGGRLDRVPVAPYLADALDRYLALEERRPHDRRRYRYATRVRWAGDGPAPLLTNANGDRLDRHAITRAVTRLTRAAGVARRVCPHDLRHAMVTLALEAGVPLHRVQDAARHADPSTTRRYDRARDALDGHATYALDTYLAAAP